ncbi:hypothetical protein BOW53_08290 [Solemya pervernicosa gill symbiont]|uniref:Response regulatory domain-containing protein n=2 Tax=Gammaproteobacteria incertae sedis TaxID=118884 RepID=A0A1T2L5S5_9GAMM|nr:response regulator [Candidatus Reidiella endopervernicosa]OOZ40296.1 hypothetical protein BOW53_08290 [Solemya pervernicosa gill symbiont]QKQ26961.1 response regulator [Candidatus Reidiella endopervernicosa]
MAKILIVDDEEPVRAMLRDMLEVHEHEVEEAVDGRDAIECYRRGHFDMVITDLVMPDMNGLDLIMALREEKKDVKILAISGGGGIVGRFDYLPIAKLIGAESILKKPFDLQQFSSSVAKILDA